LQPAEHLKNVFLAPQAQGAGVKLAPKPSLVQGFGFPLALHIPTYRQTDKHLYPNFMNVKEDIH